MTAISGIDCHNGVVLAGDGMMSIGSLVSRPTLKLSIHNDDTREKTTILGLAGDQGFDLRFKSIVEQYPNHDSMIEYLTAINNDLSTAIWAQSEPWLHYPMFLSQLMIGNLNATGVDPVQKPIEFGALLGYIYGEKTYCCKINEYVQPIPLDSNNYYDAIGSGATQAYPFLRQLDDSRHGIIDTSIHTKRELSPPDLDYGCLMTYWSIHRTLRTSPAWVGLGIDMLVLVEKDNGTIVAEEIDNAEMDTFNLYIEERERGLMA